MRRRVFFALAALILIADQITKWKVRELYLPNETHTIVPGYFDLIFVQNPGGAFGIFREGTSFLSLACFAAAIAISVYVLRLNSRLPVLLGIALALPMGGAIGNLIDRVRFHWVTDFLHVHVGAHDWPVFNVADSAICVGVTLLIIYSSLTPSKPQPVPAPEK